jgi:hypothetical protein
MNLYYGEALTYDNAGGPGALRMRKTAELLEPGCAADRAVCVPVVVAANIAYAPPRGRTEAVASYTRTSACTG